MNHVGSSRQRVPVRVKEGLRDVSQDWHELKVGLEQVRQGATQDIAFQMFIYLVLPDKCYHLNLTNFTNPFSFNISSLAT